MSRLRELMAELCPDGVEYRKLGEIGTLIRGKRFVKNDFIEVGVPAIHYGELYTHYGISASEVKTHIRPEIALKMRYAQPNDIVIVGAGETIEDIGIGVAWLGKRAVAVHDACYIFHHELNPVFISYILRTEAYHRQLKKYITTGKISSISANGIGQAIIPVPPLPIQNEIVKMLDNFTELTAELTAELALRKKQYNFYRDSLLNFVRVDDTIVRTDRQTALRIGEFRAFRREFVVEYCRLGDIAEIVRGNGLQKSDFTEEGIGCIHYGQIYTKYGTFANKTLSFVPVELATKLKRVSSGDLVVAITSENVEDICKCVAWLGNDDIVTGGHAAIIKHQQNSKYLAYVFQTEDFFRQKRKYVVGTKVIEMSPKKLAEIVIPIPPLEVQAKIVSILDRFDTLCNDLTQGLPAEIAARKKQYEYYRDKLLTFRRKEESVRSGQ
jgi:type I restriction-modification system specificity subunit